MTSNSKDLASHSPFQYELPKILTKTMNAWMPKLQAVTVVTALLTGTETSLLNALPDPGPSPRPADSARRFFAYSGVLFNFSATLSSILLLIAVASLPTTAREIYTFCPHTYPRRLFPKEDPGCVSELNQILRDSGVQGETFILRAFGIARSWTFLLKHCIACFVGGIICFLVHISMNIWLEEHNVVAAAIMPVVFVTFVPPMVTFMFFMDRQSCQDCCDEKRQW